jgi:hypothetical protein
MLDQPALTYRPLPHVPQRVVKPTVADADDWSAFRGSKNQRYDLNLFCAFLFFNYFLRTKVYSGVKAFHGEVPTLQEMCIKILQDNIDGDIVHA